MKRSIAGFFGGLLAWILIVSLLDRALRVLIDGYQAAEPQLSFTLPMMAARLTIAAVTSLLAGAIVAAIAPSSSRTPWVLGLIVLAAFVPEHIYVWHRLPAWYHLTFLLTLVPLVVIGARLARATGVARSPAAEQDAMASR